MENLPGVFPDKAGGLSRVLVSKEANANLAAGGKGHMMSSKLAVNVWEEGRSIKRHPCANPRSGKQPPPGKQRKFEVEWGKKVAESIVMPAHKSVLRYCLGWHVSFQSIHLKKIQQEWKGSRDRKQKLLETPQALQMSRD